MDLQSGDDSRDGKTAKTAWKSFVPVNHLAFASGDRLCVISPGVIRHTLMPVTVGTGYTDNMLISGNTVFLGSRRKYNLAGTSHGKNIVVRDNTIKQDVKDLLTAYRNTASVVTPEVWEETGRESAAGHALQ